MWYSYTMECYSAIKRNECESTVVRWMNLEPLIQNEVSQKKKGKYHILTSGFCIMERCLGGLREDLELVVKVRTGEVWAEGVDEGENI